jgi:AcrR family transcriptional regulator
VTEQLDRRADTTRLQILRAASRQFARRSYSVVSLDDILADAQVTKGAMYFHFRSKHALASAIIEYRAAVARASVDQLLARKLSGLETLIDISYLVAVEDIGDETARAGLNLLESIGRTEGLQGDFLGQWVTAFAAIAMPSRTATSSHTATRRALRGCWSRCTSVCGRQAISLSPSDFYATWRTCGSSCCRVSSSPTGSTTSTSSSSGAQPLR